MLFIILKFTFVSFLTLRMVRLESKNTLANSYAVLEFTFVTLSILTNHDSLAILLSVFSLSGIFSIRRSIFIPDHCSLTMILIFVPFSIIFILILIPHYTFAMWLIVFGFTLVYISISVYFNLFTI